MVGPDATVASDFTVKLLVDGLPAGEDVHYRIAFENPDAPGRFSEPVVGRLRAGATARQNVTFLWTGDTAGQGWGINPYWGGMKGYAAMAAQSADFLIHCGDAIYADGPFAP